MVWIINLKIRGNLFFGGKNTAYAYPRKAYINHIENFDQKLRKTKKFFPSFSLGNTIMVDGESKLRQYYHVRRT